MNKDLLDILTRIRIGNPSFFLYIKDKIKSLPLQVNDFNWGCFYILDDNNILTDIKVLVPRIIDLSTLLVNIHELTHAFELYSLLGKEFVLDINQSEELACSKEKEYLALIKKEKH